MTGGLRNQLSLELLNNGSVVLIRLEMNYLMNLKIMLNSILNGVKRDYIT